MVEDFKEGEILGELQDLDEEIEVILTAIGHPDFYKYDWQLKRLTRILDKLKRDKEWQQMRLRAHRQKVKDSGIKY